METSASRCLFWVSSQVSLSAMTSKFSIWMSTIHSSIFGNSDCTLAVSTFSRLLGCISLPVCWRFPWWWWRRYLWSMRCCWLLLPWQSLSFLLVAVVCTVGDRPCCFLSFLLDVIGCVAFGHALIYSCFAPVNLFPSLRWTICSCCIVQLMLQVHYFFE